MSLRHLVVQLPVPHEGILPALVHKQGLQPLMQFTCTRMIIAIEIPAFVRILPQVVVFELSGPVMPDELLRVVDEVVAELQVFATTMRFTRLERLRAKSSPMGPPQSVMNKVMSRRSR